LHLIWVKILNLLITFF